MAVAAHSENVCVQVVVKRVADEVRASDVREPRRQIQVADGELLQLEIVFLECDKLFRCFEALSFLLGMGMFERSTARFSGDM